jgi:hypothetical protein
MRVIITGGRDFNDYELLSNKCIEIKVACHIHGLTNGSLDDIEIVCGKARGADTLGEQFAKRQGYKIKYFPANWDLYGKIAGYIRNEQMALYAKEDNGVLIAFWDQKSKGTKHMIDLANKHGLKVFVVNY